ncbi:MAG: hypothetical protein ACXVA7_16135, partial [Isosphaeraceae bacterium]
LSRLVNREEQTRGAFFEGRFNSVAILDEESLLANCAYVDLNPVAAGGDGNGDAVSITEIAALRSAPAHAKGSAKSTGRGSRCRASCESGGLALERPVGEESWG